ncbi:ABC transporter permease [Haloimpatiens sp. FM7330]|uniref:ABC transporter permease n=1 Tax=Haloimpatiens sp. FM7330 TaxID=3298610 RepID=UPI00363DBCAE
MKFLYMVLANCKRYFKDYKTIAIMFLLPIVVVSFVKIMSNPKSSSKQLNIAVGVVNLDKGDLGNKLIKKIDAPNIYKDKKEALQALKNYDVIAVYEIGENFSQEINVNKKPVINSYKLETGNKAQIFEVQMQQKINELFKVQVLKTNNIIRDESELNKNLVNLQYNTEKKTVASSEFMPLVMIMFFLLSFSSIMSGDLLKLKKGKILERFLSTSNKGYQIIGSIYLSMIITQIVMYTASFMVMKVLFKFSFSNFGFLILNIALMSMVSISLCIMVNRIFKDRGVAGIFINLISMIMFFLYITVLPGPNYTKIPKIIITLSKFTPFYWSLGSIEKSVLFPNVFILLLMSLVFFTAGSIKYSNFAKESK